MESLDINEITKNLFIKNLDNINDKVLKMIEESYVEYYGINSKSKISDIFNKLKLIYISDNINVIDLNGKIENLKIELKKKIDVLRQEYECFKDSTYEEILFYIYNDYNLSDNNLIEIKEILIQLGFYYFLIDNKKNNNDKKVILYHNKNCENNSCVYDEYIEKNLDANGGAIQNIEEFIAYIQINDDGSIHLQGLVHEIGHLLMKTALFVDEKNETQFIGGIYDIISTSENKMINEVINEYISEEIMSAINNKYDINIYFLNSSFGSWYVDIDKINNGLIKKIYNLLKGEIKNNVISGNPSIIKKIINNFSPKTFDNINKIYFELLMSLINRKQIEFKTREEIVKEVKETVSLSNLIINEKCYQDVYKGYRKYLIDIQKEKEYVDELISNGKARKI